jgi:hypothetical protein
MSGSALLLAQLPMAVRSAMGIEGLLAETDLIYVSPIKTNGDESQCQAEIWFVHEGTDMYVCVQSASWRVQAAKKGLNNAHVWIGDVGNWSSSSGKYRALPMVNASVEVIDDAAVVEKALAWFGDKYPLGWLRYESQFREGLAAGTRTLMRYQPV